MLEARRDVLKKLVTTTTAHLEAADRDDPILIVRLLNYEQRLLQAELELATSNEERIAIIEPALKSIMQFEKILEDREENGEAIFHARATRIQIEIELHKVRKRP